MRCMLIMEGMRVEEACGGGVRAEPRSFATGTFLNETQFTLVPGEPLELVELTEGIHQLAIGRQ